MKKLIKVGLLAAFLIVPTVASAVEFTRTGKIVRTLSDNDDFGGCMVLLDTAIENGCPARWVSLDCKGIHIDSETGERNYASALVAASLKKTISVAVDNTKRNDNYCVATRFDIVF